MNMLVNIAIPGVPAFGIGKPGLPVGDGAPVLDFKALMDSSALASVLAAGSGARIASVVPTVPVMETNSVPTVPVPTVSVPLPATQNGVATTIKVTASPVVLTGDQSVSSPADPEAPDVPGVMATASATIAKSSRTDPEIAHIIAKPSAKNVGPDKDNARLPAPINTESDATAQVSDSPTQVRKTDETDSGKATATATATADHLPASQTPTLLPQAQDTSRPLPDPTGFKPETPVQQAEGAPVADNIPRDVADYAAPVPGKTPVLATEALPPAKPSKIAHKANIGDVPTLLDRNGAMPRPSHIDQPIADIPEAVEPSRSDTAKSETLPSVAENIVTQQPDGALTIDVPNAALSAQGTVMPSSPLPEIEDAPPVPLSAASLTTTQATSKRVSEPAIMPPVADSTAVPAPAHTQSIGSEAVASKAPKLAKEPALVAQATPDFETVVRNGHMPVTNAPAALDENTQPIASALPAPTPALAPAPSPVIEISDAADRPAPGTITISLPGTQASVGLPGKASPFTLLRQAMKPSAPITSDSVTSAVATIMPEALSLLRMAAGQDEPLTMDAALTTAGQRPDTGANIPAPAIQAASVQQMVQPAPQPVMQIIQPIVQPDLAASLDRQVIDMTLAGQWIGRMAEEIVQIASDTGRSSFRLSPQALGAMQVDIFRTDKGADVRLIVQTEAAEAALQDGRHRLESDARLQGARINDVTIVRAPEQQDASRSQSSTSQHNGQNAGQQGLASGQGQGNNNGAQAFRKPAVIDTGRNHAEQSEPGAPRARYA